MANHCHQCNSPNSISPISSLICIQNTLLYSVSSSNMALPKDLISCLALVLLLSNTCSEARVFVLSGKASWGIPSSPDAINEWTKKIRFQIGDSIVFKYDNKTDSVLEVTKENYNACNMTSPLNTYKDGNTKIDLHRPGQYFFISGVDGHCAKGEKVELWVMSDKHHGKPQNHTVATPAPVPTEVPFPAGPAPAPHAPAPAPHNSGSSLKAGLLGGVFVVGVLALF